MGTLVKVRLATDMCVAWNALHIASYRRLQAASKAVLLELPPKLLEYLHNYSLSL